MRQSGWWSSNVNRRGQTVDEIAVKTTEFSIRSAPMRIADSALPACQDREVVQ